MEHFSEEYWEEEDLTSQVARQLDKQEREERVSKGNRKFWAEELLLGKRVRQRKDTKKWSREILLDRWRKVMMGRELIFNLVDQLVDKSDTKRTSTESSEKKTENFGNTKGKLGKRKEIKI